MVKIAILSPISRMVGGTTYLFPIFRWEKQLKERGYSFDIITDHTDKKILNYKIVIVIQRYFQQMINKKLIADYEPVKEYLNSLKSRGVKIIFFDAGDSTGTWLFDLMDHVDLFMKKQLLVDRDRYLKNEADKSVRVWLKNLESEPRDYYTPCKKENLHKLKLAWNCGMVDFRYNPYKIGLLSNYFFTKLKTTSPSEKREYITSFRGKMNNNNPTYAYQRNILIKKLQESNLPVITGKTINRKEYLAELQNCKAIISPYGWGEICFRDFETFIKGSTLVKPDMSHLETFPNFFQSFKTYVPIDWELTDLEEKLDFINDRKKESIEIAENGQQTFLNYYNDSELFVNHIADLVSSLN